MKGPLIWPKPSELAPITGNLINLITVPVTLLLSQLATYTECVLYQSLFLSKDLDFDVLQEFYSQNSLLVDPSVFVE